MACDLSSEPEPEAKVWHQTLLDQRHLETYRNMHRLRDALHHRCAALLKDNVLSQRLVQQQRDEATRAKYESKNKTTKKQKKRAFSKLQHNDSYLQSLPKTTYYQIFDFQKQLVKRGHLKSNHELEDFYRCFNYTSHPPQLQRHLQDVRKKMLGSRSAVDLTSQTESDSCSPDDGGEEEDDICCSRLLEQKSGSGESEEKNAIEQIFSKMKVPTFTTLQPNIMRIFQSKIPDLVIPEVPEKSRKAEIYMRRLRQMHHLCLNNMLSCQRLLDGGTDSLCWQEEQGVQDLGLPGVDSKQGKVSRTLQPPLAVLKQPTPRDQEKPSCAQPLLSRATTASHPRFETPLWDTARSVCCRQTPEPLSIEDVFQSKAHTDH